MKSSQLFLLLLVNVYRGLHLCTVLRVVFMFMQMRSDGNSCVVYHMYLVTIYGMANAMSGEVGWCVRLCGYMLYSALIVSSGCTICVFRVSTTVQVLRARFCYGHCSPPGVRSVLMC